VPAADAGQRLHLVEQQRFQFQRGDVAEQRDHLERAVFALAELRHRGDREPRIAAEGRTADADDGGVDRREPSVKRAVRRQGGRFQRLPVVVDEPPLRHVQRFGAQVRFAHAQQAFGGGVGGQHAPAAVLDQDALVDGVEQFAVAAFRVAQLALRGVAGADVADHRDDAHVVAVEEHARMRLDREVVTVAVAVGGLDGFGAPDLEGVEQPRNETLRQGRIQILDAQPAQMLQRIAIDRLRGLVRLQDVTVPIMHGDRFGNGVEQAAVARFQRVAGAQQRFDAFARPPQRHGGGFVHGERGNRVREPRDRVLPGLFHRRLGGVRLAIRIGLHDRACGSRTLEECDRR
jgi:hypothetical protein